MKDQREYNVRAVERAIHILDCFDDQHHERGISEIAQEVGLHKATTHRIVTTLLNYGYLERSDDEQRYRLGVRLIELGFTVLRRLDLRQEAIPYMTQLSERWNETCDLSIFDHGQVFYIEVLQGNHALTISAAVGQRLPAHCTASGKLFLAHLPSQELDAVIGKGPLRSYTERTITSTDTLRTQLRLICQQGYSIDDGEFEDGIRAVAAPIRDHTGQIMAAISIPGPANRISETRIPELADSLMQATRAVSHRLGWQGEQLA